MEGVQAHASADNWIKDFLSKALPTRARPSFSRHQSIPSESLHKPLSLIYQRADRSKKKHSLAAAKAKPHYRKFIRMKNQKAMSQMKGQVKTPGKQLNEVKIGLLGKEFRIMIVKMIQDLGKTIGKMQEMFTKELEQTEMNTALQGINSRITEAEEQINDLEDRMAEITATKQSIEKD